MTQSFDFVVMGHEPLPKQSFRVGKGQGFQPERIKNWEALVRDYAALAVRHGPYKGAFEIALTFYRYTRYKVDVGNLEKPVLDAMNGVVYHDDDQVVKLHQAKCKAYTKAQAGVKVEIWRVEDDLYEDMYLLDLGADYEE